MTVRLAVSAAVVLFCLTGCGRGADAPAPSDASAQTPPPAAAPASTPAPVPSAPATATAAAPIVPGAPAFAVLYPGAELDGPPTVADGEDGPGGLATFRTTATPDAVVDYYRQQAEAAGLRSVIGLNQGEARAYGAAGEGSDGATLHVVAATDDGAATSVQLSWSAGR